MLNVFFGVFSIAALYFGARGIRSAKTVEAQEKTIDAQGDTIDSQKAELDLKTQQVNERDRAIEECRRETAHLAGTVEEQARHMDEMRQLVMGEKVPEAMAAYMMELATGAAEKVGHAIARLEKRVNQHTTDTGRQTLSVIQALGQDLEENTRAVEANTDAMRVVAENRERPK